MGSVKVKGMTCEHCVSSVTKALDSVDGLEKVKVTLDSGLAEFDETKPVDKGVIKAAIEQIGFEVEE